MTQYKNVVRTTEGTYRLWDKDFMDSIDLSRSNTSFVRQMLTDAQHQELWDTGNQILTDAQYEKLFEYYVLPRRHKS